mgnify:CR=1 FL=1
MATPAGPARNPNVVLRPFLALAERHSREHQPPTSPPTSKAARRRGHDRARVDAALRPAQRHASKRPWMEDPGRGLPRRDDGGNRPTPRPSQVMGVALQVAHTKTKALSRLGSASVIRHDACGDSVLAASLKGRRSGTPWSRGMPRSRPAYPHGQGRRFSPPPKGASVWDTAPVFNPTCPTSSNSPMRLARTQVWPPLRNFEAIAPSSAATRSASSKTMKDAFPPSSGDIFSSVGAHCSARSAPPGFYR